MAQFLCPFIHIIVNKPFKGWVVGGAFGFGVAAMRAAACSSWGSTVALAMRRSCSLAIMRARNTCSGVVIPSSSSILSMAVIVAHLLVLATIGSAMLEANLSVATASMSQMAAVIASWSIDAAHQKSFLGRIDPGVTAVVTTTVGVVVESDDNERGIAVVPWVRTEPS